jgi:hypothetical protein
MSVHAFDVAGVGDLRVYVRASGIEESRTRRLESSFLGMTDGGMGVRLGQVASHQPGGLVNRVRRVGFECRGRLQQKRPLLCVTLALRP